MILAAGLGSRMGALTQDVPKPLLKVGKKYLIEYAIESLKTAGIRDIIINIFYHAELIQNTLGDGSVWDVNLTYSHELKRLETGGAIVKALPFFEDHPFLVLSADVICNMDLSNFTMPSASLAHLVLVPNPIYHANGDFGLQNERVILDCDEKYTFGNVALYQPALFQTLKIAYLPLGNILKMAIMQGVVTGQLYHGAWSNIGTPQDIAAYEDLLAC